MTESTTTAAETATDDTSTTTNSGTLTTAVINAPGTYTVTTGGGAPPPGGATTTTAAGDEHDPARAKALIDKLRGEEKAGKAAAKERDELKARLDAIEAEKLSDGERVQKERDDAIAKAQAAETTLRDQAIRLAVYGQRDALGLASADLAIAALDRSKVEFDADGQPTNVTDLLTALIEREPILKGTPTKVAVPATDGGAGGGDKPPDLTADELEAAGLTGMTPERFAAIKAAMGGKRSVSITDLVAALSKKG